MNTDVEFHIRQNYPWNKLPANVKQVLWPNVTAGPGETGGTPLCSRGGEEEESVNVTAVPSVFDRQLYLSAITV